MSRAPQKPNFTIAQIDELLAQFKGALISTVASGEKVCEDRPFFGNLIGADGDSSQVEEIMYKAVYGPYLNGGKPQVHLHMLDGTKKYKNFATEDEANEFIRANQAKTVANPITVSEAVKEYLASRLDLKDSSKTTTRFRLEALIKGHETAWIQTFPAESAWKKLVAGNAVDTLYGVRSAGRGFLKWCVKSGYLKRNPLEDVEIVGKKRRGKAQLRIDEARKLLGLALKVADGERVKGQKTINQSTVALAAATALLLGLRNGEVVDRVIRDLDDNGKILVIDDAKTPAGVRRVEVPEVLQPHLAKLTQDREPTAQLFEGLTKDQLRWWVKKLCRNAGLPEVTPHGLRGTNATASLRANSNPHMVAAALGHTSIAVTMRHYADAEQVAQARQEAATEALLGTKNPTKSFGSEDGGEAEVKERVA